MQLFTQFARKHTSIRFSLTLMPSLVVHHLKLHPMADTWLGLVPRFLVIKKGWGTWCIWHTHTKYTNTHIRHSTELYANRYSQLPPALSAITDKQTNQAFVTKTPQGYSERLRLQCAGLTRQTLGMCVHTVRVSVYVVPLFVLTVCLCV